MNEWIEIAKELGFDAVAPLEPTKLTARKDVRDMCEENRCGHYGANRTCPPQCGELEACEKRKLMRGGILQLGFVPCKGGQRSSGKLYAVRNGFGLYPSGLARKIGFRE